MARYFIDTEFHEYERDGVPTIDLISIGIVDEDGKEFYAISRDFNVEAAWANVWLRENVLEHLFDWNYADGGLTLSVFKTLVRTGGMPRSELRELLSTFIKQSSVKPQFYGYYADYDWVVLCWLFGRMIDLPEGWPMYCRDLKQMFDEKFPYNGDEIRERVDYPKQENEHNALDDAKWNKALYGFLYNFLGDS